MSDPRSEENTGGLPAELDSMDVPMDNEDRH